MTAMIFTDGACSGNPGPGGYAALIKHADGREQVVKGGDAATTNNQMEMIAALMALEALPAGAKAVVHSDSQYVIKGVTEWLPGWKKKGWRTSAGPVKNRELWEALDAANAARKVTWKWVRGHNGHAENEKVDQLAVAEAAKWRGK